MQMHTDFDFEIVDEGCACGVGYLRRGCESNGVSKRNLPHSGFNEYVAGVEHFFNIPWLAVRVSKSHGDIRDHVHAGSAGKLSNRLQGVYCCYRRLILIAVKEFRRDRKRKA